MREPEEDPGFDPMADLLFSLVAITVLALIILLPSLKATDWSRPSPPAEIAALTGRAEVTVAGVDAERLHALKDGARFGDGDETAVSLAAIPDDAALARWLSDVRDSGRPLVLMVAPDGLEAGFELEPVIARHGPPHITIVRLDAACGHAVGAALPLCTARAP